MPRTESPIWTTLPQRVSYRGSPDKDRKKEKKEEEGLHLSDEVGGQIWQLDNELKCRFDLLPQI